MGDGGDKTEYQGRAQTGRGRPYWMWVQRGSTVEGGDVVETTTAPTFGAWLRMQRKDHDLTQEGLAERAGCSWERVRKIGWGAARPSRQRGELRAAALDVPPVERAAFARWARPGQRARPATPPAPPPGPVA